MISMIKLVSYMKTLLLIIIFEGKTLLLVVVVKFVEIQQIKIYHWKNNKYYINIIK